MKKEKLINILGDIDDKYIEEAAPQSSALQMEKPGGQPQASKKRKIFRYASIAACFVIVMAGMTGFAVNYAQNSMDEFYLRFISPEDMEIADQVVEDDGSKIYFDALKSGDWFKQYFAINKLVEFYNEDGVCKKAIKAITPFLTSKDEKLADAAAFSLNILNKKFDDPRIFHMADGTIVFTLFNDYSDYGTYNALWTIKDDLLNDRISYDYPQMYITKIIQSPDKKLLAISFVSNKSSYLEIYDVAEGMFGPELINTARIRASEDQDIEYWHRSDNENYSQILDMEWTGNNRLEFRSSLALTLDDDDWNEQEIVGTYDFKKNHLDYKIIE